MGKSTSIEIENVEEYEAINDLMWFLNTRCLVKSAHACSKEITFSYGDDFERCDRCDQPHIDCGGHDDDPSHDAWHDRYSDEENFD